MTHGTDRIGEYEIEREIARGGYGIVFRAKHIHSKALVAIKVLHVERAAEASTVARFEREAKLIFALAHPNLTQIYSWGRIVDGRPYIVMELLEGESLDKRLAGAQRLSVDETLDILEPLVEALELAHTRGIIHRDIKPANVFVAPHRTAGKVVLLDFGIAKLVGEEGPVLTTSRASLGTIPFMSPEQLRGEGVDTRSDVYALAALTYAMLTGSPPFGTQVTAVLQQIHLLTRPKRPSERAPLSPSFDEPILRALSQDRNARPASARDFVRSLRAVASAPKAQAALAGVILQPALAVLAEIRILRPNDEQDEEVLLEAMEASMRVLTRELSTFGLVMVQETSRKMVAVFPKQPSGEFVQQVQAACARAYEAAVATRLVDMAICVHCGMLHKNEAGTLLPSGLLDLKTWGPAMARGVAVRISEM